ncbi:MAG TPA: hypothetical protein PKA95_09565 [Thermomicrobiales bacterium]|nr:hypothetical protein [Thermomicrobiales bacterium]
MQPSAPDDLDASRHVTLILRTLVRRGGDVVQGEVIDAESGARSPFVGWDGLVRALRTLLGPGGEHPTAGRSGRRGSEGG